MIQATGMIEVEHCFGALNLEYNIYRWKGGNLAWISADNLLVPKEIYYVGDILTIGPFRLRLIDWDLYENRCLVTRDGWKAKLLMAAYQASRLLESITKGQKKDE